MPVEGREIPDSSAGGQSPQTLNSSRRSAKGATAKSAALNCRARVAVAEEENVHLVGRVPALLDLDQLLARRLGGVGQEVAGVDLDRPDLLEGVLLVALLDQNLDRPRRQREAQRLVEGAMSLPRLAGGLPLAVDRGEAPRVEEPAAAGLANLEEVLTQVGVVDRPVRVSRPG
jgi:hypothetical protein